METKKPHPDNKHAQRLAVESRPAGIAASTYKEGDGSTVDMIEIVGEKPRVVRVTQAAYNGIVRDGTEFVRHDYLLNVFNDPPVAPALNGPWHQVGVIVVPPGMAFDLSDVRFQVDVRLQDAGGLFDIFHFVSDDYLSSVYWFRVTVDNVLPWSSYSFNTTFGISLPVSITLNDHWMEFFDCPVHVVACEGQTVRFEVTQFSANDPTTLLPSGRIWARPRGRWMPIQHYRRVVGVNALE